MNVDNLHRAVGAAYTGPRGTGIGVKVSGGRQYAVAWSGLHAWLRTLIIQTPGITLLTGVTGISVHQDADSAWVQDSAGHLHGGDVVIGADGYRSIARAAVTPGHTESRFPGYVMWRGLLPEHASGETARHKATLPRMMWEASRGSFVFAYPVPGSDGQLGKGDRRAAWGWYDNQHNAILEHHGAVTGTKVHHSLRGADVTETELDILLNEAAQTWPRAWRDRVMERIQARTFIGTPIAEFEPDALARGRVALIGDAAHLATPVSGMGFNQTLTDVQALADALSQTVRGSAGIDGALRDYESRRLPAARSLVRSGRFFSEDFAAAVPVG